MTVLDGWIDIRRESEEDDEDVEQFDFVDCGDVQTSTLRSEPYRQLYDIATAGRAGRLDDQAIEALLCEVQDYLVAAMRQFQALPELELDVYSIGRTHILNGLETMSEACLIACFSEQKTGFSKALDLAARGDDDLRIGRQLLQRAEAITGE